MNDKQTKYPMVSVILGVYNEAPNMVRASIESILKQTYTNLELIIVIDNPDIQFLDAIIEEYAEKDKRIIVLYTEKNIGLARSLNRGIDIARGKYIARMDADDISLNNRIEIEVSCLEENPDITLVYSGFIKIDMDGNKISNTIVIPKNEKLLMQALEYNNIVVHPSVLMKTSAIKKVGGYNEFLASQDYDLWLRLKKRGYKFCCIKQPLILYRVRDNSTTTKKVLDQYLSYRYAKYIYKNDKKFDRDQYIKYVEKKKKDQKFVKHMETFTRSFQYNPLIKTIILLYYALIDYECRSHLLNFYKYKRCVKKINFE